ncbi:GRF1-interacting factor 1, partial [Cucurbita argyrosperma subsp. sororia]
MQQHLMQMQPMMAAYYPNNVTTDHIQQYLDENKSLILKIVESQNSGKLNECAENQARLQRNLMYLAAIADSQPQPSAMHAQYSSSGLIQPGGHYIQHQQAQQMTPQSLMAARSSMLYTQQPFSSLQQQALHSQLGMTSGGGIGFNMLQNDAANAGGNGGALGGGGGGGGGFPDFSHNAAADSLHRSLAGGSKQDMGGTGSGEGRGGSSGSHGGDGGENLYLKSADDGN